MTTSAPESYERVSIYPLDPDDRAALLATARECVFNWCTRDEWPMGVIMSCLWHDDRVWLTAGAHRHRVSAIRRNPKCSVVFTSTGTSLGPGKTVTVKGRCRIHEDRATKDWFYPAFSRHLSGGPGPGADAFQAKLDSPLRVVFEVTPEKFITYDMTKMLRHAAGKIDPASLGPPSSADTERLQRELEKRGLDS